MSVSASAAEAYRSGHPPQIISAVFDEQRRLKVQYKADDGLTYGGKVYLDNNPLNAPAPIKDTYYGDFMHCNKKSNCLIRWTLPVAPDAESYTFISESLDPVRFPDGTYYVQVETYNEDPYPSTRMWENSAVSVVQLTTLTSSASFNLEKLASMKLPVDNGSVPCLILRSRITLGNRLVAGINMEVEKLKTEFKKEKIPSIKLKAKIAWYSEWMSEVSDMRETDKTNANLACGTAPSLVAFDGTFIPIPIPPSNGKSACTKIRTNLNYLNQELKKVVNNISVTSRGQAVRIKQLEVRFNQLSASLGKSWPSALKDCNPI
ncbi:MAG: hypothetical protein Q8K48_04875 [Candidatus Planktophila sp.]|nr:hypothetical protein [Candidatus Planktophila sp.]